MGEFCFNKDRESMQFNQSEAIKKKKKKNYIVKQSRRINKITMNEPGQERRAIIKWHKLSFRRCVLFVAPQRLHSGAASLTGLIKLRASRTSGPEDATHLHFVFVSFVFALTGPDFKTRPQLSRFGLVCAAKAGTTSLLPAIFIVYRSRGLVAHANPGESSPF